MDFEKYINQSNMTSHIESARPVKCKQGKPKIIKFIGDMNENIKQIYDSLDCKCTSKRQFFNIMVVFGNKIQKLRKERDHYKATLKQYFHQISKGNEAQIVNPEKQKLLSYNKKNKCHTQLRQENQFNTDMFHNKQLCFSQKKQIKSCKDSMYSKKNKVSENCCNDQYMQISLNLSIIQFDHEQKQQNQIQAINYQQQKLSVLSQSNLLDSDEQNSNNQKLLVKQSPVLKERTVENNKHLNQKNQLCQIKNKVAISSKSFKTNNNNKQIERQKQNLFFGKIERQKQNLFFGKVTKKENSQQIQQKKRKVKSDLKTKKQNKTQNTIEKYIKKYTMTLQKLQQFIQKKDCIRQSQQLYFPTEKRLPYKNYGF